MGKWHLLEHSIHPQGYVQVEGLSQIKDGEIKPVQPDDSCHRLVFCQQYYTEKYQREHRQGLARFLCMCVCICVCTLCVSACLCVCLHRQTEVHCVYIYTISVYS